MKHDVIVVGGGPAGVAAAIEAARAGCNVLLVDRGGPVGGAWREQARFLALRGIALQRPGMSQYARVRRGDIEAWHALGRDAAVVCEWIVRSRANRLRRCARGLGVRWVVGDARLEGSGSICIDQHDVRWAPHIVLATGSRPRRPARFAFDDQVICDAESVLWRGRWPRRMVVIGGDLVGCEFASLFCALGVEVTLVDRRSRLLRYVDREVLAAFHDRIQTMGVEVVLEEEVQSVVVTGGSEPHALIALGSGRRENADCVLILAGRRPDTSRLELERAGVRCDDQGSISVDADARSSVPHILAVGGACGTTSRGGESVRQAAGAIAAALGRSRPLELPPVVSHLGVPEFAMVGLTDEASRLLGNRVVVGRAALSESLASRMCAHPRDFVKVVVGEEGHLLGVHAIGDGAVELAQLGAALVERGARIDELASAGFAEPSITAVLRWAAIDALTQMPRDAEPPSTQREDGSSPGRF